MSVPPTGSYLPRRIFPQPLEDFIHPVPHHRLSAFVFFAKSVARRVAARSRRVALRALRRPRHPQRRHFFFLLLASRSILQTVLHGFVPAFVRTIAFVRARALSVVSVGRRRRRASSAPSRRRRRRRRASREEPSFFPFPAFLCFRARSPRGKTTKRGHRPSHASRLASVPPPAEPVVSR